MGLPLAVQWLGLCASIAGGTGLIPGLGTKIPQAVWLGQKFFLKKDEMLAGDQGQLVTHITEGEKLELYLGRSLMR